MTDEYHSTVFKVPFVGGFLKEMDKDIAKLGFHNGMRSVLKKTRTSLKVIPQNKDTLDVLQKKAVVVVSNHPCDASDVVTLFASMPERCDSYLIINVHFVGLLPAFDAHMIPVYIRHHAHKNKRSFQRKVLTTLHPKPVFSADEEHKKNLQSMIFASKRLEEGSAVTIFPGRNKAGRHWYSGMGHMIAGTDNWQDICIVYAYIKGTGNKDYLRLLPGVRDILPTITIYLSRPVRVGDIVVEKEGKDIAGKFEQLYHQWVDEFVTEKAS